MTSQLTLDCRFCRSILPKNNKFEMLLKAFSGDINKLLPIKTFYNNLSTFDIAKYDSLKITLNVSILFLMFFTKALKEAL